MVKFRISGNRPGADISRHIFGQFTEHLGRCIYDGLWVGEDSSIPNVKGIRSDLIEALKAISVPNIRWPGGCFADAYHWRDGIGPREGRPRSRNHTWGIEESNAFGTHEFLDLCRQTGAEPVLCGNVGSGTVEEMRDWLEYLNCPEDTPLTRLRAANGQREPFQVRYWGVGNESWGCGGNMRPEYYADLFRRYGTYLQPYGDQPLERIACGPCVDDVHWTEVLMKECSSPRFHPNIMNGLTLHYYVNGGPSPEFLATCFGEEGWSQAMAEAWHMKKLLNDHISIMDRYDPDRRIALIVDEWGSWYAPENEAARRLLFQQQTIRDALIAALTLHCFMERAERVRMANLAQMVNVLQSLFLTFGPLLVRTPTWHVFQMYQPHHDASLLPVEGESGSKTHREQSYPLISILASQSKSGAIFITLANTEWHRTVPIRLELDGVQSPTLVEARILSANHPQDVNDGEFPERVCARPWQGPVLRANGIECEVPPASIVSLMLPGEISGGH